MQQLPNILIITFDCVRPDHLGGLGYRGTHTPTFDRFINEGTTFLNAYCQAPNTWISHASLFTGCNPYLHGVRTPARKVSDELSMMAEILRDMGYATFGLPAMSLLSKQAGFGRGFNEYRLDGLKSQEGILSHRYYRSAADTLALTSEWLGRTASPFFGWIHYFATHKVEPELLDLPEPYKRAYSPYAQYYDGKIAFADSHFLAPLAGRLASSGQLENTIIILWSDHGENLHLVEHGPHWGHNWTLEEDVMRTLLIMRGPGFRPAEMRSDIAQSIDIFPTLLELLELPPLRQFEGRSLLSDTAANDTVYMENLAQGFVGIRRGDFKLHLSENRSKIENKKRTPMGRRLAILRETFDELLPSRFRKRGALWLWWRAQGEPEEILSRLLQSGRSELYDLSTDAEQSVDLSKDHPSIVTELRELIRERASRTLPAEDIDMSETERDQLEERLRALGYL